MAYSSHGTNPTEGGVPEEVTESFEEAESFAQEFEGWTFADGDQSAVGGFQGADVPGITAGSSSLHRSSYSIPKQLM